MKPAAPYPLLGPCVVIDQRMARATSRLLAIGRREAELEGVHLADDVVALIETVEALASHGGQSVAASSVDVDGTMSTREAAQILRISDRAVRMRIESGALAGHKRSGAWRVLTSAVAEAAEAAEVADWAS